MARPSELFHVRLLKPLNPADAISCGIRASNFAHLHLLLVGQDCPYASLCQPRSGLWSHVEEV